MTATLPTEAELLADPDVVHMVSVSGGKDSTGTYCTAIERVGPEGFRAVAADTGNENALNYRQVDSLHVWTGGPQVEWVKADFTTRIALKRHYIAEHWPNPSNRHGPAVPPDLVARALAVLEERLERPGEANPYLDMCLWKGRFPSRKAQFCTVELKVNPIQAYQAPLLRAGRTVVSWQGVRRAESIERRFLDPLQELNAETICGEPVPGRLIVYRPLLTIEDVEDVFAIGDRHGVPRNPLYALGASRVGCWPCINCQKGELALVDRHFPEDIDRLERWERIVAEVCRRGCSTFFNIVNDPVMLAEFTYGRTLGQWIEIRPETHGIRRMVEWAKTGQGGRQYPLFDAAFAEAEAPAASCNTHGVCE